MSEVQAVENGHIANDATVVKARAERKPTTESQAMKRADELIELLKKQPKQAGYHYIKAKHFADDASPSQH